MDTTTNKIRVTRLRPLWLTVAFLAALTLSALSWKIGLFLCGSVLQMAAIGVFAVLQMTFSPKLYVPVAIASLVLMFFLGGNAPLLPAICALSLLASGVLRAAVGKKSTKSSTAILLCLTLLLGSAVIFAVLYRAAGNSLAPADLLAAADRVFTFLRNTATELTHRYFDSLTEEELSYFAASGMNIEETKQLFLTVGIGLVELIRSVSPAILLILGQLLGYLAVCFFVLTAKCTKLYALLPEPRWALYPTHITCILFMITLLLYMVTAFFPAINAFSLAVMNLLLILTPSMTACGVRGVAVRLRHPLLRRRMVIFLIIFAVITVFTVGTALPFTIMILAFLGARDVSSLRMAEAASRNKDNKD